MVLQEFYEIGLQDVPQLREIGAILELSPVLKVSYTTSEENDIVFTYLNGKTNAFLSGDPKSLIAFYHVVNVIGRLSDQYLSYPSYIIDPLLVNLQDVDELTSIIGNTETSESMKPSALPQYEPFTNVTQIIFLLLPIILLASIYSLSLMSEKARKKITFLLLTPFSRLEILVGKMIPYILLSLAFSGIMAFFSFSNWLPIFFILVVINLNFFALAMFIPLVARSFKEYSFLSTFTYFSFFFLLVFPNLMYGLDSVSNLSPLSLLNDAALGKAIIIGDVLMSFLPFIWLSISIIVLSVAIFQEEIFLSKKNFFWMAKKAFTEIEDKLDNTVLFVTVSIFLIIPFIYFAEIILAMIIAIFPPFFGMPLMILSFAFVEESFKIAPFIKRKTNWIQGALAGALFFIFEKGVNIYIFLSVVESLSLYSTLVTNIWITLIMHIITTSILFTRIRKRRRISLVLAVLIHAIFNLTILGVVANV